MSEAAAELPMLVDTAGRPLSAEVAGSHTAHYGADMVAPELRGWYPQDWSADGELLNGELETLRARTKDLIRNHGLASGAVQIHLDNIIGPNLRLASKPDHRRLGISPEAAAEWARMVEARFREWADDHGCYVDAARRHNFAGLLAMGYRSYLTAFELLSTIEWLPDRPGAKYATAIQAVDPARLSNPRGRMNGEFLREGVELGDMGEPVAYWIASRLIHDVIGNWKPQEWRRVPRETPWGRQMVVHVFDGDMPGQNRGKTGVVSVISKLKMLEKFEQVSLQAAILNAMYAAVIESPFDWQTVGASLGQKNERARSVDPLESYMGSRAAFHKEGYIRYNGVKIPHLYPGEKFELKAAEHPNAAFSAFEEGVLRHIAGGFNLTYEQLSRDYSKTNYSSARAAMLEAWRFFTGRRHSIAGKAATAYYAAWLEEAIDKGEVPLPDGGPDFYDARAAYTRCKWIGPGRGHIDPLKEENATTIALKNKTTTLEDECAERGRDWEEVLEQRAQEAKRKGELEAEYGVSLGGIGDEQTAPTPMDPPTELSPEEIDEAEAAGDLSKEDAEQLREDLNAYGMAVRAGVVTPQTVDEDHFRQRMSLPAMGDDARKTWTEKDKGTRRPVTLTPPEAGGSAQASLPFGGAGDGGEGEENEDTDPPEDQETGDDDRENDD